MMVTFAPGTRDTVRAAVLSAVPEAREAPEGAVRVVELEAVDQAGERAVDHRTVVICGPGNGERLLPLWASRRLAHLLLAEAPAIEVAATLRRTAGPQTWGAADLLEPTEHRHAWATRDSTERPALIAEIERHALRAGASRRSLDRLVSIAEELISNALFDAPVDPEGRHLHAHRARTERVTLDGEPVRVELLADAQKVALVVCDRFGSLTAADTFDNIARCARADHDQVADKAGGAGLGLYTVLTQANHLVITVAAGRTEVVALVDKRAVRPAGRCFNWFGGAA